MNVLGYFVLFNVPQFLPPFFPPTKLKEVVLKSGKVLRADVCIVGIGKCLCEIARLWGFFRWLT